MDEKFNNQNEIDNNQYTQPQEYGNQYTQQPQNYSNQYTQQNDYANYNSYNQNNCGMNNNYVNGENCGQQPDYNNYNQYVQPLQYSDPYSNQYAAYNNNQSKGLAIASMILGIVSVCLCCLWYVTIFT